MGDTSFRRIRMGMVGGGLGAFIGPVHRRAAELDGQIELVSGAFSRSASRSREAGRAYGIDPMRAYADFEEMMERESRRSDPIDFVSIVTPNDVHFAAAASALRHGFHVVSDKPATTRLQEAVALKALVEETGLLYALTYTYTGYPMIREARRLVRAGGLGEIRKVVVNYPQGWVGESSDDGENNRAFWRMDPQRSGVGGTVADIGSHALNLIEYVSGKQVVELSAELSSMAGWPLDDDCNMLLRLENGAPGVLIASQISTGERNGITLDLYGKDGGLHWTHNAQDCLRLGWRGGPDEIRYAAANYLAPSTRSTSRMPVGHPEGIIEALANIYRDFAASVRSRLADPEAHLSEWVPGIEDGVRGMAFIEQAVENSRNRSGWVRLRID